MEENLRILLAAYEEEKKSLEAMVKQDVAEEEYLMAYHHREALSRVNAEIRILKRIDNPFGSETDRYLGLIKSYESVLDMNESMGKTNERIIEMIVHFKKLLKQNEALAKQSKQQTPVNIIWHALNKLCDRKIQYFKIYLNRDREFYFKLTYTNKILLLVLPEIKRLQKNCMMYQWQMDVMLLIGFQLSVSGNKLAKTIHGNTDEIIVEFNLLFSKIVFDIFYGECAGANHAVEFGPAK